jgi:hypothetical protein
MLAELSALQAQMAAPAIDCAQPSSPDRIAFTACSTTLPAGGACHDATPVTRSFSSLSQAAEENALSRILVGFHFRNAITQGLQHGGKLGHHTFVHYLRPVR